MGKPRRKYPVMKKPARGLKKAIAGMAQTREKLDDLKKNLGERTHQMLVEEFGTYIQTFDAILIEHKAMKQLFIEKGLFTRKELNKRYLEIKGKK